MNRDLALFRYSLLNTILLTVSFFSILIATGSLLDWFPLGDLYENTLYAYGGLNIVAYFVLKKNQNNLYFIIANIIILASLPTLIIMTIEVINDEFRIVWFFLVSFASFILIGKKYGLIITVIIVGIVITLYSEGYLSLSEYAIFTFICALIVFNIFSYYFLIKIESDSNTLEEKIKKEVDSREEKEQILLRQYRMVNLGEMVDTIAHQWRQPLMQANIILLNIDDTLEDECDKKYIQDKIVELGSLITHMSQTIDDFRNMSNNGKETSVFLVDDLVTECLSLMRSSLNDITITYIQKKELYLTGYKNELIQVLIIIVSNAIEALEQAPIKNKKIHIYTTCKNETVIIDIEDNAKALKYSTIEKIFDPYFTTKKQSGGIGLGLYIAKIIIEQNMRGRLTVEEGKEGAKFRIEIRKKI